MGAYPHIRMIPQSEVRVEIGPSDPMANEDIVAAIRLVVDQAQLIRAACWFAAKCRVTPVREPALLDDTSGSTTYSAYVGCEANACPLVSGLDLDNSQN